MRLNARAAGSTSPRLRGEVGSRSDPGEGGFPRTVCFESPPPPHPPPPNGGGGGPPNAGGGFVCQERPTQTQPPNNPPPLFFRILPLLALVARWFRSRAG